MALVNAQQMDRVRIGGKGKLDGNGILFCGGVLAAAERKPALHESRS